MSGSYAIVPVITSPELQLKDYAVWYALCSFAEWDIKRGKLVGMKEGTCHPTAKEAAKRAGCSFVTFKKSIRKLDRLGYVVRIDRREDNGRRTGNDYFLKAE